jgi:hypothetical protein
LRESDEALELVALDHLARRVPRVRCEHDGQALLVDPALDGVDVEPVLVLQDGLAVSMVVSQAS